MTQHWLLLAQDTTTFDSVSGSWHSLGSSLQSFLVIFGSIAVVTAAVVVWAVYLRKRRRHHHHHQHHHGSGDTSPGSRLAETGSDSSGRHHRRRRRRRAHRPRNPTLAETGGLPPVRPERPPEPFP